MDRSKLLHKLQNLETELHQEATRRNAARMNTLLHPEFEEIGPSGRRYSRDEIVSEFASANVSLPTVVSHDFELSKLNEGVALLTYVSAHLDATGNQYRHRLRSSLWILTPDGWQMRFHQGTPLNDNPQMALSV